MLDTILFMIFGLILVVGGIILWIKADSIFKRKNNRGQETNAERTKNETWRNIHF